MKEISSIHNPLIKKILLLQEKSKYRKAEQLFVIDGWKETKMAIANHFNIETILFSETLINTTLFEEIQAEIKQQKTSINLVQVSEEIFQKIAVRGNTSKVVAVAEQKVHGLSQLQLKENAIVLVLDAIEKPGNLGAILRIADAANIDAVLCCDIATDIYNPNVIRSSVGCLFTTSVAVATKETILQFLQEKNIAIYTTSLKAAKNYLHENYTQASAFVFGTEANGVDVFWENNSTQNIIIPMRGQNDSLNVSNSVAIVLFEALRQRT
ncbi:MAG: RNA methyltransferase [Chitinophagales bacterium]|nr:RNA methyltransferase [Bacteroidota bacterium]